MMKFIDMAQAVCINLNVLISLKIFKAECFVLIYRKLILQFYASE